MLTTIPIVLQPLRNFTGHGDGIQLTNGTHHVRSQLTPQQGR